MRRSILIVGLFLLALVGTVGCGTEGSGSGSGRGGDGGPEVNLEEYVVNAERVCARHQERLVEAVDELDSARESHDYGSFLPAFRGAVAEMGAMFDRLSGLTRPPSLDEALGRSYRQANRFIARYEASADALERGDVTTATTVARGGLKVSERWKQSMSALGLNQCAKAIGALQPKR